MLQVWSLLFDIIVNCRRKLSNVECGTNTDSLTFSLRQIAAHRFGGTRRRGMYTAYGRLELTSVWRLTVTHSAERNESGSESVSDSKN